MSKSYKSELMAAVHETAASLQEAGVMDKKTMRYFDEACLTKVEPMTPAQIRALREANQVSQSVCSVRPKRIIEDRRHRIRARYRKVFFR